MFLVSIDGLMSCLLVGVAMHNVQRLELDWGLYMNRKSESCCIFFFMWGLIPATMVQRIASAMQADMRALGVECDPRIAHLASLGSDGKYPNNIRSQLIASFKSLVGIVQPCWIRVPALRGTKVLSLAPTWIDHPMLVMNELFDSLFHHFPTYFARMLGGGLESFWNKVAIIQWVLI